MQLLISERRIRARVAILGQRITSDYAGASLHLIIVLKGAAVFSADLMRRIGLPLTLDFVAAASYGAGMTSSGSVALAGIERLEVAGRDVLVIEDILDSGRTSAAIIAALRAARPSRVALCALLRKPAAAALDLPVYAVGFDIPDVFVIGYGMDHGERHRNLRDIHRLGLDDDAGSRQDDPVGR